MFNKIRNHFIDDDEEEKEITESTIYRRKTRKKIKMLVSCSFSRFKIDA